MRHPYATLPVVLLALASFGCAEVYTPRPSGAVVITGNGFGGYRVYKNGENYGSEWSIRDAVNGDPRAESEADSALSERIAGIATGLIGAAGIGVGAGLVGDDYGNTNSISNTQGTVGLSLFLGGLALAITSGFLQGAAHTHTFNAANMYNDDMAGKVVLPPGVAPPAVYVQPPESSQLAPAEATAAERFASGPGYARRPVNLALVTR